MATLTDSEIQAIIGRVKSRVATGDIPVRAGVDAEAASPVSATPDHLP